MAEQFDPDTDGTDNELEKELTEVFKKHGYVAFVYGAAKDKDADRWFIDTTIFIDDDHVLPHQHENVIDAVMTDLVNLAHEAIHDIQDRTPKQSELKH